MAKQTSRGARTKYRGVFQISPGRFLVRGKHNGKTFSRKLKAGSPAEAEMLRLRLLDEFRDPAAYAKPSTVGDAALAWLKSRSEAKRPDGTTRYSPATLARLDYQVRSIIVPTLGGIEIPKLTRQIVQEWRDHLASTYRASSTNATLHVLRCLLLEQSGCDVARQVRTLTVDDARINEEETNRLDAEQTRKLLEAAQGHELYPLALFLVLTAARIGTALASRWEDVDVQASIITFRRRLSAGEVLPGVKRGRQSRDKVPVPPVLLEVLDQHRSRFNETQAASGLLFPGPDGGHLPRHVFPRALKAWKDQAGIPGRLTPHGLRRTATLLWREAAGAQVSMQVAGHLTLRQHEHYSGGATHREKQDAAVSVASRIVGSGAESGEDTEGGGGPLPRLTVLG